MKRLNINETIWFVILLCFTSYIYILLSTGRINIFIHPKMLTYVKFSYYGFIILSLFQVRKLLNGNCGTKVKLGFVIFLIPLILGFAVNPHGLNADAAGKKGVTITQESGYSLIMETGENQNNLNISKGEKVEVIGFVYREEGFKENEFIAARVVMSCCAADANIAGIMCRLKNGEAPPVNQWVRITGRVDSMKNTDKFSNRQEVIPVIIVDKIESIEKPDNEYIYH